VPADVLAELGAVAGEDVDDTARHVTRFEHLRNVEGKSRSVIVDD